MAEQKTVRQAAREQFKVVENPTENMLRAWSDLSTTTTGYAFDTFDKTLRYNEEARAQASRVLQETFSSYRRLYHDGFAAWQSYIRGINDIMTRTN